MTDYFIWNGVDCRTKGIHVSELPPITIPLERSKQTNVPGRPGSLTQLEGEDVYDDMILTTTCFIADPAQIPVIAAWLKGKGTVTFDPRHRRMAQGKRNSDLRQPDRWALQRPDRQSDPV